MSLGLDVDDDIINPLEGWIKLISAEGHEFIVRRECVSSSGTIRAMLNSGAQWAEQSNQPMPTVQFQEISTNILENVIQYWHYKQRYDGTDIDSNKNIPQFNIDVNNVIKLLLAANFLDT